MFLNSSRKCCTTKQENFVNEFFHVQSKIIHTFFVINYATKSVTNWDLFYRIDFRTLTNKISIFKGKDNLIQKNVDWKFLTISLSFFLSVCLSVCLSLSLSLSVSLYLSLSFCLFRSLSYLSLHHLIFSISILSRWAEVWSDVKYRGVNEFKELFFFHFISLITNDNNKRCLLYWMGHMKSDHNKRMELHWLSSKIECQISRLFYT